MHNYRWRQSLAPGEARYDADEQRLADRPTIAAPTITISSDFDGPAKDDRLPQAVHRTLRAPGSRRTGHNVPKEAPADFTAAAVDVSRM